MQQLVRLQPSDRSGHRVAVDKEESSQPSRGLQTTAFEVASRKPVELVQLKEGQVRVPCRRLGGRSATHKRLAKRPCSKFADEEIRTSRSQPSWRKN